MAARKATRNERAARGGGAVQDLTGGYRVNTSVTIRTTSTAAAPGQGASWMGPGQSPPPVAPPEVAGRTWDFPVAYNLNQTKRPYEPVSFGTLRNLAESYDLLRLAIETRKDQAANLEWVIRPKDEKVKVEGDVAARVKKATEFFERPDRERDWDTWLRLVLEDLFVLDAPAIYRHRTRGGELFRLKAMDGSTIGRLIDDWGDTPLPPAAAYRQILKGMNAVFYTTRDLIYRPRNPRTDKAFGFSPVEQVIVLTNIGLRRQSWQLNFFSEGNMPDALIGVPQEWSAQQIAAFQEWFDNRLAGDPARRRGGTFVPGDVARGYVATKQEELFGAGEEWLARVVCYAFSLSPQWAVKMMNRATGETAEVAAEEEGLQPIKRWIKGTINLVLAEDFGSPDLTLAFRDEEEVDAKTKAEIIRADTESGLMVFNEAREAKGLDPYQGDEFSKPMVKLSTGWTPIALADQVSFAKEKADAVAPPVPPGGGSAAGPGGPSGGSGRGGPRPSGGGAGGGGAGASKKDAASPSLAKLAATDPAEESLAARRAVRSIKRSVAPILTGLADDVAGQIVRRLTSRGAKAAAAIAKGDPTHGGGGGNDDAIQPLNTAIAAQADEIVDSLDLSDLEAIPDAVEPALFDVAGDSGRIAIAGVGVRDPGRLVDQVNQAAVDYARDRAAELVGMRYTADGDLIPNPNARWAIDDSTREMLRRTITAALEENIGTPALAERIQADYAFSAERADLIARTEVRIANSQGKMIGWRLAAQNGVTGKKSWLLSNLEGPCEACERNAAKGAIALEADFPSGHETTPAHPNCRCVTVFEPDESIFDDQPQTAGVTTPG